MVYIIVLLVVKQKITKKYGSNEPFNMAFDSIEIPDLANKKELNILEIGFGSGACIGGIFNYFEENNKKRTERLSSSPSSSSHHKNNV